MVPLLFAFLLLGQASAEIKDFDQLVDRAIGRINTIIQFFGYDHFDISAINSTYSKKLGFMNVIAGLVCERGSLDFTLFRRLGSAQADVSPNSIKYSMSLEVPTMNAEVGPCTFTISDSFSVSGQYKANVNATSAEVELKIDQVEKKCRLEITALKLNVSGVYIYSGASFTRALQDWTFDAVSYLLKDKIIEMGNKEIESLLKKYQERNLEFPCNKPFEGNTFKNNISSSSSRKKKQLEVWLELFAASRITS